MRTMMTSFGPADVVGAGKVGGLEGLVVESMFAANGSPALLLVDARTGESIERLSANVEGLGPREVAIRAHEVSDRDRARLLFSGLPLVDTGRVIRSGFVEYPVWRLTTPGPS